MKSLFRGVLIAGSLAFLPDLPAAETSAPRPNILWLVCEDAHVSWFGCYGNAQAKTPNIDQLAAQGFRYTNAYASAPVCAASRSSWITGINALSMGTQPMRSRYEIPHGQIKYYPDYLRQGGYFTTNLTKTDYNIGGRPDTECWDSTAANPWELVKPGQPFFEVFNFFESHESKAQGPVTGTRHSPNDLGLAKYHPDLPGIRMNYAKYYDAVENLDIAIGKALATLKKSGQEENTIVIFCSDHAGVLPRSKRFLYDSGTHSPLILRIPEKFKALWPAPAPGAAIDRLVSFLDFPKTWLSITDSPIPKAMQGDIFFGPHAEPEPQYAFSFRTRMDERYDSQRSARDKRFLYVKNYMPFVSWGQHLDYLWKMVATQVWEQVNKEGKTDEVTGRFFTLKPNEELYDCVADPDNVKDLASNPEYKTVLETMRGALRQWQLKIHDAGMIPEAETDRRATENKTTIYEMAQNPKLYDLPAYLSAADVALAGNPANAGQLIEYLKSDDSGLRYWGAVGYVMLKKADAAGKAALKAVLNDPSGEVSAMASWALILAGEEKSGQECMNRLIRNDSPARLFAMNVLDWMNVTDIEPYKASLLAPAIHQKEPKVEEKVSTGGYESAMLRHLSVSHGLPVPLEKSKGKGEGM